MSMTLSGMKTSEIIPIRDWCDILQLAEESGWNAMGTKAPGDEERDFGYVSNDGQLIEVEDARNLAAVLERAFPRLGTEQARIEVDKVIRVCKEGGVRLY